MLPDHIIEDLKEIAHCSASMAVKSLSALISCNLAWIWLSRKLNGPKDNTIKQFSHKLTDHGVPEQAMQSAIVEIRDER